MRASVSVLSTLIGGSVDATANVSQRADGPDLLSSSRSFCTIGTSSPPSSAASVADAVCMRVLLTKSVEDFSVLAEGSLEATESNLDLRPFGSLGSAAAPLSESVSSFSAVSMLAKNSSATGTSPRTWKKLSPGGGNSKSVVSLPLFSLNMAATSLQSKSPFIYLPKQSRHFCNSASFFLFFCDVVDYGA